MFSLGSRPSHGVAVAEIAHDMAPDAAMYLATVATAADLQAAVAWFDSRGVDVITRSLASPLDGPGDGTGPTDAVAANAVARGMLFVNSAGNHAGSPGDGGYWRGQWRDDDADDWLDFASGVEDLEVLCGLHQGLRWDDWGEGSPSDYDLYIYSLPNGGGTLLASSEDDQTSGADPVERVDCPRDGSGRAIAGYLRIKRFAAGTTSAGDTLEFMINGGYVDRSSNPHSATQPISDSATPGVLSVGAIDPAQGNTIAPYSSRGPTNDERIKPDLVAHSCVATKTYGSSCFNGTSALAPVVAGAAALVIASGAARGPARVAEYLTGSAVRDRGPVGLDSTYGAGELRLPKAADPCGSDTKSAPFVDMAGSFAKSAVDCLYKLKITTGTSPVTYSPKALVTREQMAAFLARLYGVVEGEPAPVVPTGFRDTGSSFARDDIARIFGLGVTTGTSPTTYSPKDIVTREQMAAFLARMYRAMTGTNAPVVSTPFSDTGGSFARNDIARIYGLGLTTGTSPTTYSPKAPVTREQMAAFLTRLLDAVRTP
ncbi:MAG: S-layer homology domain-containing protein [Acidimicrobiales bacterium]